MDDANTLADPACDLSDGSVAGDWYLPNIRELFSLVDFEKNTGPTLPMPNPFMNFLSSFYWSSTTFAVIPGQAWGVNFSDGDVDQAAKTGARSVLPVRGGKGF